MPPTAVAATAAATITLNQEFPSIKATKAATK